MKFTRILTLSLATVCLLTALPNAQAEETDQRSDYLTRLFVMPIGRTLPSGYIACSFGGAFASQGGKEYLGLFSVGLGGVAELEFSTTHLVSNAFNTSEPIGTTALRFLILRRQPGSRSPELVAALRSNQWSNVDRGRGGLSGPAAPDNGSGVQSIDFETHLTSLYLSGSYELTSRIDLHGGLSLEEVRTRDLNYGDSDTITPPGDFKGTLMGGFLGLERNVNENTHSMFEIGTKPGIHFDDDLKRMKLEQVWYGMAGIRFFISRMTALDAGLRYRSDFTGLADTEIHAGVNVGIDLVKMIRDAAERRKMSKY